LVRAADGSPPELVAYADQKHHVRAKAVELGVPVADGEVVTLPRAGGRRRRDYDALRSAVHRHLGATGQAIVRGAQGAAGASTFVVGGRGEDVDGLLRRLGQREDTGSTWWRSSSWRSSRRMSSSTWRRRAGRSPASA
jgi:hypothetical protein